MQINKSNSSCITCRFALQEIEMLGYGEIPSNSIRCFELCGATSLSIQGQYARSETKPICISPRRSRPLEPWPGGCLLSEKEVAIASSCLFKNLSGHRRSWQHNSREETVYRTSLHSKCHKLILSSPARWLSGSQALRLCKNE
jgi:hypothetical protein